MKQQSGVFQEFLTEFRKLKEWSDDNPEVLEKDAESDESIAELCARVSDLFLSLKPEMKQRTRSIYENVGSSVISAFWDYENRYDYHVTKVALSWHGRKLREYNIADPQLKKALDLGVAALDAFLILNQSKK